ncbi:immunity 49 family protein [Streptomyces sp. NBC_00386]
MILVENPSTRSFVVPYTPCPPTPRCHSQVGKGSLTGDQQLLRVLLADDQAAFERALEERLVAHRESGADPAARSLLPVGVVMLAALACLAHGRKSGIRSAYPPEALVSARSSKKPTGHRRRRGRAASARPSSKSPSRRSE